MVSNSVVEVFEDMDGRFIRGKTTKVVTEEDLEQIPDDIEARRN